MLEKPIGTSVTFWGTLLAIGVSVLVKFDFIDFRTFIELLPAIGGVIAFGLRRKLAAPTPKSGGKK